ncbi:hypothetical protein [Salsuginibacillus kocurii]|uniref:hypothetical protein n=1 Tax=Salsuginibacillus kocurii TaxID=427078 RepID=UPI00036528EA|nr:hypothetical protein [Salsuginibacillus kocurii]
MSNEVTASKLTEEPVKLFTPGQTVFHKEKQCTIIAEYQLSVTIEYVDYPFQGQEEEFPFPRTVVKKEKVQPA